MGGDIHHFLLFEGFPANRAGGGSVRSELGCGVFAVVGLGGAGRGLVGCGLGEQGNEFLERKMGLEATGNHAVFTGGDVSFEKRALVEFLGFQLNTRTSLAVFGDAPDAAVEIPTEVGLRG